MTDTQNRPVLSRVSTGNAEADEILRGGFPANSINVIMGQPGTGKSIFIEELVFHNADGKRPILYLTTLSEPVAKTIRYLQQFSFFDGMKVGTEVIFEDIGGELAEKGLESLFPRLRQAIESISPKIIVIDSFKALHDLGAPVAQMRKVLFEIASYLSAYDTTAFLVGEYTEEHARQLPEFAIADGIVQLMRKELSTRDERFLRVLKLRGSSYIEGFHGFRVTSDGVVVYPRLVSPDLPTAHTIAIERVATGIEGLDAILGGGLLRRSTTLVAGPTGAGKTTLSLQFVSAGLRLGEKALYVNFQENPTQLARSFASLRADADGTMPEGMHFLYMSPVELQIDHVVVTMFARIREHGIQRLVIDSLGDLASSASDPDRFHDYLYAMVQHLSVNGVTTLVTMEAGESAMAGGNTLDGRFSYMSDAIILLKMSGGKRTLMVGKARGTAHDILDHDLVIEASGLKVASSESPPS